MAAIAGYQGRLVLNGTTLRANSYSITASADLPEVTNFESLGIGQYIPGVRDWELSFDAHWFSEDNPFRSPILLVNGAYITNVDVYILKTSAGTKWSFTTMLVMSVDMTQATRDTAHYTARLKNTDTVAVFPTFP